MPNLVPDDLGYITLLFGLFVVPSLLQRFRIPAAITSLGLGMVAGPGLGLFQGDATIELLSTLGIVALFLFAGLDVNVDDLRRHARMLAEHIGVRLVLLALVAFAVAAAFDVDLRQGTLVSLALLTPSTGFILDSLGALGLSKDAAFWVRTKAIATEIVALVALFITLQSTTASGLLLSSAALVTMVLVLPALFYAFARFVVPHAPKTEFAFLLMVSVAAALVTKQLGVYYLVGAFVVGLVAQRFRRHLPALASEKMLHATEAFGSIFIPFYFFHAGVELQRSDFTLVALGVGVLFLLTGVPLRLAVIAIHRRIRLGEGLGESFQISMPLTPTLVFTLVIAEILRGEPGLPDYLFGSLVVYALGSTVLPSVFRRAPSSDFEPRIAEIDVQTSDRS